MSLSRRRFLRAGSIAGLAGLTFNSSLSAVAQRLKGVAGSGQMRIDPVYEPLAYYTMSAFTPYVGSIFRLQVANRKSLAVTLAKVVDQTRPEEKNQAGRECFTLIFKTSGGATLNQGTYDVSHSALGAFKLFLVPGGNSSYVAVINRMPYNPALVPVKASRY